MNKIKLLLPCFCLALAMVGCSVRPSPTPLLEFPTETAAPLTPTEAPTLEPSPQPTWTPLPPTQTVAVEMPTEPPPGPDVPPSLPQPARSDHYAVGDRVQLDRIHMVTRTDGWGISGATVLTTRDGGLTWREVSPPVAFPVEVPDLAYGAFLDTQTAWVVVSYRQQDQPEMPVPRHQIPPEAQVWHTTDGGSTWTPSAALMHQAFGDDMWAEFAVLDAQHLWLLVRGVYVGAGTHYNHELFSSADGGLTWNALASETSNDYTGLVFADPLFGLRTLQTTGAYAEAPPAYEVTFDGGATWEERELPAPPAAPDLFTQYPYCETYQPVLISAQSIRMLMGCFDYQNPPEKFASYFYSSQDGGLTWASLRLFAPVRAFQDTLVWLGNNQALLLGRNLYETAQDGTEWYFIKAVTWDGQFSFTDHQYGWAVATLGGEVALVHTADWARTWDIIKPTISAK